MLDRRNVVKTLLKDRGNLLVIAGLGASAWDVTAAGDNDLNFPLWGGMGGAVTVGLGLALAQPTRSVLVITGDGEMLMGLGSLATLAVSTPKNLSVVVLDNERYGETGSQKTHTAFGVDLVSIAKGCGFCRLHIVHSENQLSLLKEDIHKMNGCLFSTIKISNTPVDLILPPRDGTELKNRFRKKILGKLAMHQN